MTSSSSFSASSGARKNMLDREVTPFDEASSSERTTSFVKEEKSSEDTPSVSPPQAAVPVALPQPAHRSRKRKHPQPSTANPGPSGLSKKAKRAPQHPPIVIPEYSWVHSDVDKHMSIYNTRDKVGQFVVVHPVCEDPFVEYAVVKPCRARERIYMKPSPDNYDFTYVYDYLFKEYNVTFPLIDFEAGMLTLINIAPSQLHPNSWAFVRCFKLLCGHLGLVPSISVFTYFYQMKFGKLVGWVSLSASHGSPLFTLYNSSYKHFKPHFFKLCCCSEDAEKRLLFRSNRVPRHPLYWQKPTRFQPLPDYRLTAEEKVAIGAIQ